MKIGIGIISASGIIVGLNVIPSAAAIEPPPETSTPPAALLQGEDAPAQRAESSPFIGIATAEVPDMVADHLGLAAGTGVIIRTVCPDSPAEKAGLSANDIITSLDGKPVASPDALTSVILGRKAGDRLKVDLIHKGKPAKVEVTLAERPADAIARTDAEPLLDGIPKIHADRLRSLFDQNLGAFGRGDAPDSQFENAFRQMRERLNLLGGSMDFTFPEGGTIQQNSTIRLMDGEGSIEIKTSAGDTQVKVRGTDNRIIWEGPWNTAEDKAAAPEDIRDRVEKVSSGNGTGFSFRLGNLRDKADTIDN
ncbi:PDZ domain-containing protein [Akkermansiaceae bacterium]|nr:PDZ domain-containing protein [Akkermansiaceae bacterium]